MFPILKNPQDPHSDRSISIVVGQVIEEPAGMYESYWNLSRPPFPACPDADGFIARHPPPAA